MTQPCNFNCGELCKDTVEVLKTCCKDVPTVFKSFYATCPPDCAMTAKMDLIRSAYAPSKDRRRLAAGRVRHAPSHDVPFFLFKLFSPPGSVSAARVLLGWFELD